METATLEATSSPRSRAIVGEPVHEQHAHLVTGEQHVVPVVRDGRAHAVGVGVGGHHEVGLDLLGELEGELERLAELGLG